MQTSAKLTASFNKSGTLSCRMHCLKGTLEKGNASLNETCWSQFDKNLKRLVLCDETSSLVVNLDFNPIPVIVFKCIES